MANEAAKVDKMPKQVPEAAVKSKRGRKTKYPDLMCPKIGCLKKFSRSKDIQQHIKRVHDLDKKKFKCNKCEKSFLKKFELKLHRETHKSAQKRDRFMCDDCEKAFSTKSNLARHIYGCFMNRKQNFSCTYCERKFVRKDALQRHESALHGGTGDNECEICLRKFPTKSALREHIEDNHIIVTKFQCEQCPSTYFKAQISLTKHLKNYHSTALVSFTNRKHLFLSFAER